MLNKILLISMCCAAAYGSGQLSIVDAPASLHFKSSPEAALDSASLSEVYAASLGLPVVGSANWAPLTIRDPFNPAPVAVHLLVNDAADQQFAAISYPLTGADSQRSLAGLVDRVAHVQHVELVPAAKSALKDTAFDALKPQQNAAERKFVGQLEAVRSLAADLQPVAADEPLFATATVSFDLLAESSPAARAEAGKLLHEAVQTLSAALQKRFDGQALFAVVSVERESLVQPRQKRQAQEPSSSADNETDSWNLAADYNEDYPVIFNIVLWFGVVFVFSLLAISYAIGNMDPGRDSIIYRMTSTRMKKDN